MNSQTVIQGTYAMATSTRQKLRKPLARGEAVRDQCQGMFRGQTLLTQWRGLDRHDLGAWRGLGAALLVWWCALT